MSRYLPIIALTAIMLMSSCEKPKFENPLDPDTELNPEDWVPTSLTIEMLTDSDALLSWQKSEIEATGFKVERQDTTGGTFIEVGSTDTTNYTDTALLTGNEYLYQVCAYSGDNQSSYAISDTIVTTFPAPYEMSAVPDTNSMIVLTWADSTAYESGFVIERKNILNDAFTVLDSTAGNTYQDTTVTLGNEYVYKVGAYSQYNTSSTDTISVKYWQDCLNAWGGSATTDNCGTCDSNAANDCDMDCAGNWGGDLVDDNCGVCDGDNSPLTGSCDCYGAPNGEAYTDGCGACVGGLTGEEACADDCLGVLGGDAVLDSNQACCPQAELDFCYICNGDGTFCDGTLLVPSEYSTIQSAIDAASAGDNVLVSAGTYIENINFNGKNISVIGAHRETTFIDGNQNGSVVVFENGEASTTLLKGFTIKNGSGNEIETSAANIFAGGGILILNNSRPQIVDCIIKGNYASQGGAVYTREASASIQKCIITDNTSYIMPVLACTTIVQIEIINCTIYNNIGGNDYPYLGSNGPNIPLTIINTIIFEENPTQASLPGGSLIGGSISYSNIFLPNCEGCDGGFDPLFCDVDNGDFTLASNSPCVGTGQDGVDMGALGVGWQK